MSPTLPHHPEGRPFILGHRGARAHEPENTMRAFQRALSDGGDGIEVDVRMTSDGALRIAHDESVQFDGQDAPLPLGRLSSAQLRELNLLSGDSVPSLMDVLRFQAETGCLVNVELKGDVRAPAWMCDRAAAEIRAHGGSGIVVSSFSAPMVRRVAQQLPAVPCALLFDQSQFFTKRFLPLKTVGAVGAHPQVTCATPQLIERVHRQGAFVGVWTVNDVDRARELARQKVDILIGDDPGQIVQALSAESPPSTESPTSVE